MSASDHLLQDDQWKMTENYNEWSHDDMLLWFQGLNDDRFYDEYEDAFKQSDIDGEDFKNMMNVAFVQETFDMEYNIASQLAAIVKHRVKQYSSSMMEYSSSRSQSSLYIPSSEAIQSRDHSHSQSLSQVVQSEANSLPLSLIDVIVPRIKCDSCGNVKLEEQNLYQCIEKECKGTKSGKICCKRCFNIYHKIIFQRDHEFDHNNDNIICINYMLNSFRNSEYEDGERAPLQMKRFQRFNKIQHFFGSLTAALTAGTGEATTYLTSSAEMMSSITGMTGEIVLSTLGTSLLGGGIGAALSFGIEVCAIFWRYYHGKIDSKRELIRLIGKSFVGNTVAFGGFMGGFVATTATFGALVGSSGGPVGVGVGIVIGIIVGLALRWKVNKIYDKVFESQENNERINLQQNALDFFHFGNDVSIIQNEQVFNKKEITRRYHGFALIHHPDMNLDKISDDDDDEKERINGEWLALCSYYGILIAICDERDSNNNNTASVIKVNNNMNEEHLSLLDH